MPATARPIATVVIAAVLFGSVGTAQELGPDGTTPLGVGAVRAGVGAVVLWSAILSSGGRGGRRRPDRILVARHWPLFVVGGVGTAIYTPMFLAAVDRTGVAVGTVLAIGSGPFFTGALEWIWRAARPAPGWLIGTALAVAGGAALVVAQTSPADGASLALDRLGVLCALFSAAGAALYAVSTKVAMEQDVDPVLAMAVPFTAGSAVLAVLAISEPFAWLMSGAGVLMALHLGVVATGVGYLLFGYGLHRLSTATAMTLVLTEPLTAVVLATLVLGESIVVLGWLSIAVLGFGLYVVGRTAKVSSAPIEVA